MSLKAARARPRGSMAKATASTDVRKTSARIQTLESSRNFGGTLCDSKTALLPPLGYGSYMPVGCVLRMTWQFGSQLTKTGVGVERVRFSQSSQNFGDRKCLPEARTLLARICVRPGRQTEMPRPQPTHEQTKHRGMFQKSEPCISRGKQIWSRNVWSAASCHKQDARSPEV